MCYLLLLCLSDRLIAQLVQNGYEVKFDVGKGAFTVFDQKDDTVNKLYLFGLIYDLCLKNERSKNWSYSWSKKKYLNSYSDRFRKNALFDNLWEKLTRFFFL